MTAQFREKLLYKGEEYYMATEPLYPYLVSKNIKFYAYSTACWRGYKGRWIIENDKLYLVDLEAYLPIENNELNERIVGLDYLFPGQNRVFASWFTGEIRIPHGEMMRYVHQGYASLFEKELFLKIKAGYVIGEYEKDNTHFYNDEKEMMERNMNDLLEALFGEKVRKKRSWLKRLCKWMETKFRYLFRI